MRPRDVKEASWLCRKWKMGDMWNKNIGGEMKESENIEKENREAKKEEPFSTRN